MSEPYQRILIYVALCAIAVAPVLAVPLPALGDSLNHIARMHVLATIGRSAALRLHYETAWAPIPYLAMDAVVPALARVMPLLAAVRLFICACVLLPVAGAVSLHRALHGRIGLAPAAAFLLSYNFLLSLGFLNFVFASGVAVMLFAGWIAAQSRPPAWRALVFCVPVTLLYLGHAFAWAAYCLCIAGYEVAAAIRAGRAARRLTAIRFAASLAQALPALVLAASFDVGGGYVGQLHTAYGGVAEKLVAFAGPVFFTFDKPGFLVAAATCLLLAILGRCLVLHRAGWPAALALAFAGLAVPHLLFSTWGTDLRLPMVMAIVLAGTVTSRPLHPAVRAGVLCALGALTAVKSADAFRLYRANQTLIDEARGLLRTLPIGARLLTVDVARATRGEAGTHDSNTLWSIPNLAVIDRDAFVPTFFSGVSTVHIRPSYRASSTPNGFPITPAQLWDGMNKTDRPGIDVSDGPGGGRLYHFGWPAKFDHVLVERMGLDAGRLPPNLTLLASTANFELYAIRPR